MDEATQVSLKDIRSDIRELKETDIKEIKELIRKQNSRIRKNEIKIGMLFGGLAVVTFFLGLLEAGVIELAL